MPLISEQLPSLVQGISQQPAALRTPDQVEDMVNCVSALTGGVRKRPPFKWLAKILDEFGDPAKTFFHLFRTSTGDARLLVIEPGGVIRLWDVDAGAQISVQIQPNVGTSYFDTPNPAEDLRATTVADYTFVLNRTVVPQMDSVGADLVAQDPLFFWLNRVSPGDDGHIEGGQFQYEPNLNGILVGTVQDFQDLPDTPSDGDIHEVVGSTQNDFATHFVRRTSGSWEETVKPGLRNLFDASTMPHALVTAPTTAQFGRFSWEPRRVGDDGSNPHPSFIGRTINDIFFFKGRLGFLVGENIVVSEFNNFGSFHRKTVLDLLETAPIDVAVNESQASELQFALPFNVGLMAFAERGQFRVGSGDALTPSVVSIDLATRFEMDNVRPVHVGNDVYFVTTSGESSAVREYFVEQDTFLTTAANITGHVPNLIPRDVRAIAAAQKAETIFVLPKQPSDNSSIYVYQFFWEGNQKVLSSWKEWKIGDTHAIHHVGVLGSTLYAAIERADGTHIEVLEAGASLKPEKSEIFLFADHMVMLPAADATYDGVTDSTTWTTPYDATTLADPVLIKTTDFTDGGARFAASQVNIVEGFVTVHGNHADKAVYLGENYLQSFTLSEQFVRDRQQQAVNTGRLQLLSLLVSFEKTDSFRTVVYPYGEPGGIVDTTIFTPGRTLTTQQGNDFILDSPVETTGDVEVGLMGRSKDLRVTIENDQHTQATFTEMEWSGNYVTRTRNI